MSILSLGGRTSFALHHAIAAETDRVGMAPHACRVHQHGSCRSEGVVAGRKEGKKEGRKEGKEELFSFIEIAKEKRLSGRR